MIILGWIVDQFFTPVAPYVTPSQQYRDGAFQGWRLTIFWALRMRGSISHPERDSEEVLFAHSDQEFLCVTPQNHLYSW